jgi:hypothetical protein
MAGECAHLAQELRGLKARTGLSLAALAERTPYSKSSWERYLNGKKPVPKQAVEALCAVAGEPCARLLALWELADAAWSGRAVGPVVASASAARTGFVRRRKWVPYVLLGAGAVLGATAALLGLGAVRGGNPQVTTSQLPTGSAGVEAGCRGVQCEGRTPMGMGCGQQGAATSLVDRYAREGQRLEIRYSEVCRSMWVRASHLKVGDKVALYPALKDAGGAPANPGEADENGGKVMRARAVDVGDATGWVVTAMTAPRDPSGARVCLEPVAGGTPECFGK